MNLTVWQRFWIPAFAGKTGPDETGYGAVGNAPVGKSQETTDCQIPPAIIKTPAAMTKAAKLTRHRRGQQRLDRQQPHQEGYRQGSQPLRSPAPIPRLW